MRHQCILTVSALLILLSACATAQGRREAYISENSNLKPEIADAIREGRIMKGMTDDDVRAAWGDPKRETVTVAEGGTSKIWAYETPIGKNFTQGTVLLTFQNGKLVKLVN